MPLSIVRGREGDFFRSLQGFVIIFVAYVSGEVYYFVLEQRIAQLEKGRKI